MKLNNLIAQLSVPGGYSANNPGSFAFTNSSINDILKIFLEYGFVFAGIALFIFLAKAGFGLMTSGGDAKKIEQAKGSLTSSLIGFFIVFASYWIYIIVKYIFGIV